jgi:hypothetical protein
MTGLVEAHPLLAGLFVAAVVVAAAVYVVRRLRGEGGGGGDRAGGAGRARAAAMLVLGAGAALAAPACKAPVPIEVASFGDGALTVGVGQRVTLWAELRAPADELGAVVSIVSDNGGLVVNDTTANVPALDRAAAVDVTGLAPGTVTLRAFVDPACADADPAAGCGAATTVTVVGTDDPPMALDSLLPDPALAAAGDTLTMVVTLRVTPVSADAVVTLSEMEVGGLDMPAEVRVPPGERSAQFDVTHLTAGPATLTAAMGDSAVSAVIAAP